MGENAEVTNILTGHTAVFKDKIVLILVETLEPPIIANFLLVEFLISLIAVTSFKKFNPGAERIFLAI